MTAITVKTNELISLVAGVTKVMNRKAFPLPVLNNVLLKAEAGNLWATSNTLDRVKTLCIPASAGAWAGTVPPKTLLDWLRVAGEGVETIALEWFERDNVLSVQAGRIRLSLKGITAEEFPMKKVTQFDRPSEATIKAEVVKELAKTSEWIVLDSDGEDVALFGIPQDRRQVLIRGGQATGPARYIALKAKDLAKAVGKGESLTVVFDAERAKVGTLELTAAMQLTEATMKQWRALNVKPLCTARVSAPDVVALIGKRAKGDVLVRVSVERQAVEIVRGDDTTGSAGAKVTGETRSFALPAGDARALFGLRGDCVLKLGQESVEVEEVNNDNPR